MLHLLGGTEGFDVCSHFHLNTLGSLLCLNPLSADLMSGRYGDFSAPGGHCTDVYFVIVLQTLRRETAQNEAKVCLWLKTDDGELFFVVVFTRQFDQ